MDQDFTPRFQRADSEVMLTARGTGDDDDDVVLFHHRVSPGREWAAGIDVLKNGQRLVDTQPASFGACQGERDCREFAGTKSILSTHSDAVHGRTVIVRRREHGKDWFGGGAVQRLL